MAGSGNAIGLDNNKHTPIHEDVRIDNNKFTNGTANDGSGNIRSVCFLDALTKLFELDENSILELKDNSKEQEIRENILGSEFLFEGRARQNSLFNR